jgi:prefoldin alpha subunit
MTPEKRRELMFRGEMINQQLERLQDYMQRVNKQEAEVMLLKEALDQYERVQEGDKLLVPVAAGMFVKAKAVADKTIQVNAGQNIVVPKSVADVNKMLDEQLSEMRKYETELQQQFDAALAELQRIEKEFEGA